MQIRVCGDGVAARSCARLLRGSGLTVSGRCAERTLLPVVMVGRTTQALFRDVFERDDLFENHREIGTRIVAWGPHSGFRALPHAAAVIGEQQLLQRMEPCTADEMAEPAPWTVIAAKPLPDGCRAEAFGARTARAFPVRLRPEADRSACWIESLQDGWAFLIPSVEDTGWLLAVGDLGDSALDQSRGLKRHVSELTGKPAEFPANPRISWPLCGTGWIACGSAALAFDPLCGDGSGHAVREAILAAAVLRLISRGGNCEELLAHYRSRLLAGFLRHLQTCAEFYRTGGNTLWWQAQLESTQAGIEWCRQQLDGQSFTRYRLRGFDLEPVPPGLSGS